MRVYLPDLAAQSADTDLTCSVVGISPVKSNQNKPSGNGSDPPSAFGSNF